MKKVNIHVDDTLRDIEAEKLNDKMYKERK